MASGDRFAGTALYVAWNGTELTDVRSLTINGTTQTIDITAVGDSNMVYLPSLEDNTFQLVMMDGGTATASGTLLYNGAEGTLEFAPQGTADGLPGYRMVVLVSGDGQTLTYNDAVVRTIDMVPRGSWLKNYRTNNAHVWASGDIA